MEQMSSTTDMEQSVAKPIKKITKTPILNPTEEKEIFNTVSEKAQRGEEVLRQEVIDLVVKIIKSDNRKNTFRNGIPGDKWFSLFRRRNNKLFLSLDDKAIKILEKVGFTEKVTNTVFYSTHKTPVSKGNILMVPRKRRQRTLSFPPVSTPAAARPVSPCSDESEAEGDGAGQESQPADSSDFHVGNRLEVMDFNDNKWYPVKIVEVDYEEGEVLVHFEKWNNKYDEWVRMDSNRIRRPVLPQGSRSKKVFEKEENVLAVWAYNQKYAAVVKEVLPNDKYQVLFRDGYAKILRGCKLFKATEEELKKFELPPPKKPAPPMGADPIDPDLGPKEERRLKKRKLDVLESYLPQKRLRLDGDVSSQPSSSPEKPNKMMNKPKGRFSLPLQKKKEKEEDCRQSFTYEDEDDDNYDNYIDEGVEDSGSEEEQMEERVEERTGDEKVKKFRRRKKRSRMRPFNDAKYQYRPRTRPGVDEDPERWNVELPPGAEPVKIRDFEGHTRLSVLIPDRNLPPGWTKHTMRRRNDSKWDVFLVNPEGRKFRSRNELRNYFAELNLPFPESSFDFQVGRKMEMIRSQVFLDKKLTSFSPTPKNSYKKRSSSGNVQHVAEEKAKITTPKNRLLESESKSSTKPATPPFPLSEMRTPDGGYTCCGKNFRKENLFQMHMKHYHPEYSNLFGSTPNVADLAYARTVGEPIEDSRCEAMSPTSSLGERVAKFEAESERNVSTPDTSRGIKSLPPKEELLPAAPDTKAEVPGTQSSVKSPTAQPTLDVDVKVEEISVTDKCRVDEGALDQIKDESTDTAKTRVTADSKIPVEEEQKSFSETKEARSPETNIGGTSSGDQNPQLITTDNQSSSSLMPVPTSTSTMPVIKPVSKLLPKTSEPMIVQTTPTAKTPITITKCMPPGHKSSTPLTKVTISLSSTSPTSTVSTAPSEKQRGKEKEKLKDKENDKDLEPVTPKFTIKTLLPMRPPKEPAETKELLDIQKPKLKDAVVDEESPTKTKPRKRTASETIPKKPKLVKPSSGSLDEKGPTEGVTEVRESPSVRNGSASYRFSRNRSQALPRVSLEKLNVTTNSNGTVLLGCEKSITAPEEVKTDKATPGAAGPGRRGVKRFKAVNRITRRVKDVEGGETYDNTAPGDGPSQQLEDSAVENSRKDEIINCTCGYMEEDGLMIQCDLCLCWQHGMCNSIDKESEVPEKYVCAICLDPPRHRVSLKHLHNQDWLKEGKLATLSFRQKHEGDISQRENTLKKSHDLAASLLQLRTVIRSLRVKTHIATKPDHPKLYLWAKSWKKDGYETKSNNEADKLREVIGPQPEAAIDETECRLRLLEHVEDYQQQVDNRLTSIQAQLAALEAEDPDSANDESSDHYPVTKQTVQMILRDLMTVRKVIALN